MARLSVSLLLPAAAGPEVCLVSHIGDEAVIWGGLDQYARTRRPGQGRQGRHTVRAIEPVDTPWFVAADICRILAYPIQR